MGFGLWFYTRLLFDLCQYWGVYGGVQALTCCVVFVFSWVHHDAVVIVHGVSVRCMGCFLEASLVWGHLFSSVFLSCSCCLIVGSVYFVSVCRVCRVRRAWLTGWVRSYVLSHGGVSARMILGGVCTGLFVFDRGRRSFGCACFSVMRVSGGASLPLACRYFPGCGYFPVSGVLLWTVHFGGVGVWGVYFIGVVCLVDCFLCRSLFLFLFLYMSFVSLLFFSLCVGVLGAVCLVCPSVFPVGIFLFGFFLICSFVMSLRSL